MSHKDYLRQLLEPLGVYDLEAPCNGGELDAQGEALDGAADWLEEVRRESDLCTAQTWGLERVAQLLVRRPVALDPRRMARSLAALLRIGGDSFTLEAINDAIAGCGINARAAETYEPGTVEVYFPEVAGIPAEFPEISRIIEDILPAHVTIRYVYWYVTWAELEEKVSCWQDIEDLALTWESLEKLVEDP